MDKELREIRRQMIQEMEQKLRENQLRRIIYSTITRLKTVSYYRMRYFGQ